MSNETKRSITREPLLHFLILGACLLGLEAVAGDDSGTNSTIRVSSDQVDRLQRRFERRRGRAPDATETRELVETYIDEEILVREARSMGLHRRDPIVRRRLIQVMRFLHDDLAPVAEPTDAEIRAYFEQHRDRYRIDPRLTIEHVFFRETGRSLEQPHDALREGAEWRTMGDPFIRGRRFDDHSLEELSRIFGASFARKLRGRETGRWIGPLQSNYGLHFVRIIERSGDEVASLETVRPRVERDMIRARQREADRRAIERLRESYRIEHPDLESHDSGA